jgi:hypothetical protein
MGPMMGFQQGYQCNQCGRFLTENETCIHTGVTYSNCTDRTKIRDYDAQQQVQADSLEAHNLT